ncbi:MAG TPA: class I SAM-dependent methyltransferase [Bacillota bacterium]
MKNLTYLERLARHGIDSAHPGGIKLTQMLLANEDINSDTVLMDAGCGTGQTVVYIGTHYPCKIVAIDLNPEMIAKARQKFSQYNLDILLKQASVTQLPFRSNSFDIILSESVTVFTEIDQALREYYRTLKPGGVLLAIEATALQPLTEVEAAEVQAKLGIKYLPTQEAWCESFQKAGFSEVSVLWREPLPRMGFTSFFLTLFFRDYQNIMRRYHHKLQYGVYRCKK